MAMMEQLSYSYALLTLLQPAELYSCHLFKSSEAVFHIYNITHLCAARLIVPLMISIDCFFYFPAIYALLNPSLECDVSRYIQ